MTQPTQSEPQVSDLVITEKLAARLELIAWWRGGIAPDGSQWFGAMQAERLGLVSTARALDSIARASMRMLVDSAHSSDSPFRLGLLYGSYCLALCEAKEAMQEAVRSGGLVLRSSLTGLPILGAELGEFFGGELRSAVERFELCAIGADWSAHDPRWPDSWLLAPGGIRPEELIAWCADKAISHAGLAANDWMPNAASDCKAELVIETPAWEPTRPERDRGYGEALYRTLLSICATGATAPPGPREILAAWDIKRPPGILRVLANGFEYLATGSGEEKFANVEALGKAIARMTKPKPHR